LAGKQKLALFLNYQKRVVKEVCLSVWKQFTLDFFQFNQIPKSFGLAVAFFSRMRSAKKMPSKKMLLLAH
jgi:hypothetical protein